MTRSTSNYQNHLHKHFVKKGLSKPSGGPVPGSTMTETIEPVVTRTRIAERIQSLQTNGELNWRRRVQSEIITIEQNENIGVSDGNNRETSSVMARLSLLEKSQLGWKKRVSETDAALFTVQAKLEKAGKIVIKKKEESIVTTERKLLSKLRSKGSQSESSSGSSTDVSFETSETPLTKTSEQKSGGISETDSTPSPSTPSGDLVLREVASNAPETFTQFFSTVRTESSVETIDESSFSAIESTDRVFLGHRRNVRVNRKHGGTRNPVKALATRYKDQTYYEPSPEVIEREIKKRVQLDNVTRTSLLSVEALAGLASSEDFTAIKLKKGEIKTQEFPHPMLIEVKGKRIVQVRLVRPSVSSISSGDAFILVQPDKVFSFIGEFSNRMERSKTADVLSHIVQNRDLGCRSNCEVISMEEPLARERDVEEFYGVLGGGARQEEDNFGDEHDEDYELSIVRGNRVFSVDVDAEELRIIPEYSGSMPKYSMLQEDKVFIFDFNTEMYVWYGSRAAPALKRLTYRLAKLKFQTNPESDSSESSGSPLPSPGTSRPDWCWLKKANQHMEPILFREKFSDWPDQYGKIIRVKEKQKPKEVVRAGFNFVKCDVENMRKALDEVEDPMLELEGFDVGRGNQVRDQVERREYMINTQSVQVWRTGELTKTVVEGMGHFNSAETYVIRWVYSVMKLSRTLKGQPSKHSNIMGRTRTVYFFWHGKHSKITDKGASALMTVELDQEKGPQVRVVQGREPPAFLNLFKGNMFVHMGTPEEGLARDTRLYIALGNVENEGHLVEVPMESGAFRSRGSFLVQNSNVTYVWHGSASSPVSKAIAAHGADELVLHRHNTVPERVKDTVIEMVEGSEPTEFLDLISKSVNVDVDNWRRSYNSRLVNDPGSRETYGFHFSSLNGTFEASPVLSPIRKMNAVNPWAILQEDLYQSQQPSLFLIIAGSESWLWQGWRPRGFEDNENTETGTGDCRWVCERRAALETAVDFSTDGSVIHAGYEPLEFKTLFPYWEDHREAMEINEDKLSSTFEKELKKFEKTTYTLTELQSKPEEVDRLHLETYLSDADFESLLKMSRAEFNGLQAWKKTELKKQAGLF